MAAKTTEIVDAGQLFIFIGAAPGTGWLDGVVARDSRGFVLAGPDLEQQDEYGWPLDRSPYHLETSVPGVFVAGDVRAESAKRVASAVGEGAMAVMFVHRYLETLVKTATHPPATRKNCAAFSCSRSSPTSSSPGCASRATSRPSSPARSSPRAIPRPASTC